MTERFIGRIADPARCGEDLAPGVSQVTSTVRAGLECDDHTGCVIPPLHLSSTFAFRGFGEKRAYDYTRSGNPTRDLLAEALTDLEQGAGAVVTASGMAAVTLAGYLVPTGARIVAPHDCYGGTYRLFDAWRRRGEREVEFVDFADLEAVRAALGKPTALLWIETPSNPLLRITDIAAFAAAGRSSGALIVVDNTFLSPAWQQPLTLGADLVVHSTTKYLNGHSDVVGGAVVARDPALHEQLAWWANCLGLTGAPFDSYLTLRGLRTLHARLEHHARNAHALSHWLEGQANVRRVWYPGLASHPGHELARRQQRGFGAIISLELEGGHEAVREFVAELGCFSLAESLGGVESLVAHPATMTHAAMDPAARLKAGLADGLIRLSIGIEALEDLRADLARALERAARVLPVRPLRRAAAAC
ncbi:MAG TPA: cystathionine gamma-synthase [Steroidobacteraceae bacterium]|jgi:cystathionine gamma-synthase|nr:cystathionine gamma-synthase [Steroidobacteraceae bacterium]